MLKGGPSPLRPLARCSGTWPAVPGPGPARTLQPAGGRACPRTERLSRELRRPPQRQKVTLDWAAGLPRPLGLHRPDKETGRK